MMLLCDCMRAAIHTAQSSHQVPRKAPLPPSPSLAISRSRNAQTAGSVKRSGSGAPPPPLPPPPDEDDDAAATTRTIERRQLLHGRPLPGKARVSGRVHPLQAVLRVIARQRDALIVSKFGAICAF